MTLAQQAVLRVLGGADRPITVAEIAGRTRLARGTCSTALADLRTRGVVRVAGSVRVFDEGRPRQTWEIQVLVELTG